MIGQSISSAPIGGSVTAAPVQPGVTAPGVPRNVAATAGINSMSVSFQAPLSDGGAAVVNYTVQLSTGQQKTVTSSPAVFTGLSAGVARTAQVAASNTQYTGAFSAPSNSVTPTQADPGGGGVFVPASRTVVFPGFDRVVTFPASSRAVIF